MKRKAVLILLGLALGAAEIWLGWSVLPDNGLGVFLIFVGLGYCIGGAFFLAAGWAPGAEQSSSRSDRTLLAIAPGALLILLGMPLEYHFLTGTLPRGQVMQWAGLGIILFGLALRIWVRVALKKAYQGNLQVLPGQQVITTGPYRWVRHPGYSAFLLQALGLGIGFSSLAGLLGVVLLFAALRYRIRIEEQMMVQAFGESYMGYAKHTTRLIPGIW